MVTTAKRRDEILSEASESFGLPPAKIEDAMFADLPKEQILEEFKEPSPDYLLKLYNVSLIQTLLMNSLELIITLDSHYQQIFRFINYLGLMYRTDGKKIEITGPLSIFRKTRKYGKEIAKLVPIILRSKSWELKAKIELKYGSEAKIYDFILSSHDNGPLFKNNGDEEKDINVEPFDSGVEERFYKKFQNFNTGWKIKREPIFIKTGAYVTIPDFGFYKYEKEILLEVVGFWTPEYLKKKIEKLNKADQRIIAVVNKKLNCTRKDFPGEVIFYTKEIPIKPILKILQEEENKVINRERKELENLTFTDDIVLVKEKARELSVTEQTIKSLQIPGYQLIKEKFISDSFLKKLKTEIGSKRDYPEVKKILDKYSISNSVLDVLGFKIIWDGLYPTKIR
jgi:predicted nuclease of restriction endonuclease-like RecB superfamily